MPSSTIRPSRRCCCGGDKLRRLPLSYYDSHSHGDILSRVTNDLDTISTTLPLYAVVKAFGHEDNSIDKFRGINEEFSQAYRRANFISGIIFPAMNFISNLGYVLIAVVGGLWINSGRLTVGSIVAFIQYSRSFTQPILQTANIAAATAAHADHFIRTLLDGYDTVLNEDVTNLSQGQKQLLTIARAIVVSGAILRTGERSVNGGELRGQDGLQSQSIALTIPPHFKHLFAEGDHS